MYLLDEHRIFLGKTEKNKILVAFCLCHVRLKTRLRVLNVVSLHSITNFHVILEQLFIFCCCFSFRSHFSHLKN